MATDDTADQPTPERTDDLSPQKKASFWQVQLALAEQHEQDYVRDGKAVIARYKKEKKAAAVRNAQRRFNILYSNVETLKANLYGRTAKPDVRRRFADPDPVARQAAEIIERGLTYCQEAYDIDTPIQLALHDHLLPGRGVMRVIYEPIIDQRPAMDPFTMAPVIGADGSPLMEEYLADQILRVDYVYWQDYLQSPARKWGDVWWVAYRHSMSREDLRKAGFPEADAVPLNWQPQIEGRNEIPESLRKAEVWEIWDKTRRERVWIVKGWDRPLRVDPDPYGLMDFFPQPEPLIAIADTDTCAPTPEFSVYEDQANDLDEIVSRISRLTKALKRRGVYDKAMKELARLAKAPDNEFIGVENWAQLSSKGGLKEAFQTEDISMIAVVLKELYLQRDMLVQAIYEVSGIADIMRGQSDPRETATAQKIKANFGSERFKKRQRQVQKWIRDTLKLKAEILAEHFEPQVLAEMTGIPEIDPRVIELLRSDKLRSYRIDIETDSTVFEDAEAEKQAVIELITSVSAYVEKALPAIQMEPLLAPLVFELLGVGVRTIKQGRRIEEVIEQTQAAIMQKIQQAMQQPQGDPEQQKVEAEMQRDQQKHELDMRGKEAEVRATEQKAQIEHQRNVNKLQTDALRAQMQAQMPQPETVQ